MFVMSTGKTDQTKKPRTTLKIFHGQQPTSNFWEDTGAVSSLPEERIVAIVGEVLARWGASFSLFEGWVETQPVEERARLLMGGRLFRFIFRECIARSLSSEDLRMDLAAMGFTERAVTEVLTLFNGKRESLLEQEREAELPFTPIFLHAYWRLLDVVAQSTPGPEVARYLELRLQVHDPVDDEEVGLIVSFNEKGWRIFRSVIDEIDKKVTPWMKKSS